MNVKKKRNHRRSNPHATHPPKLLWANQRKIKMDTFDSNELDEAIQALEEGEIVKYMLPHNISSKQILRIAKKMRLNTTKLRQSLSSSKIVSQLIMDAVQRLNAPSAAIRNHDAGYVEAITQVIPLECELCEG